MKPFESSHSYEAEVIAAVQYKVVLRHPENDNLINAEILQKMTPTGSQYYLNDAALVPTDVSKNLDYAKCHKFALI